MGARPADDPRRRRARAAAGVLAGAAVAVRLGVHRHLDRCRCGCSHRGCRPVGHVGLDASAHAGRRLRERWFQPAAHGADRRGRGDDGPRRPLGTRPLRHGAAGIRGAAAGVCCRRGRDGRRERPDRAVPRARIAVDCAVRVDRVGRAAGFRPRVGHEVLRARRL